jgi:hypothetical protein
MMGTTARMWSATRKVNMPSRASGGPPHCSLPPLLRLLRAPAIWCGFHRTHCNGPFGDRFRSADVRGLEVAQAATPMGTF